MMNQPGSGLPLLGLSLTVPRTHAEQAIQAQIGKGSELIRVSAADQAALDDLKRKAWSWVLETCNVLQECFGNEAIGLHFSSSVYVEASVKFNDFERELDEFPAIVRGRLERLSGLLKTLPVVPEPPAGEILAALLHPRIARQCWRHFELGHYPQAMDAAFTEIEGTIKDATAGSIASVGLELLNAAFNPNDGRLVDKTARKADREGLHNMLVGLAGKYQGLPSYASIQVSEAARVLCMASHLLFLIESLPAPLPEEPTEEFSVPASEDFPPEGTIDYRPF